MWNKPATIAQLTYLQNLYEKSIGYCKTLWYLDQVKQRGFTKGQAAKEIERLRRIRAIHGPTAMYPLNWEKINPSAEVVNKFMDEWKKKCELVVEDL